LKHKKNSKKSKSVWAQCRGIFDLGGKERDVKKLEEQMAAPGFWDDQEAAHKVIEACNALKLWTVPLIDLKSRFQDVKELFPEAEELGDGELLAELTQSLADIDKKLGDLEVRKMLSGELDNKECYLEINAGAGGTESCDWAAMLSRMYQRWATKRGWKVEVIDRLEGEIAGIKNMTF
jgi:peptide chain release factor 2